jgi:hypothetical protein
VIEERGAEFLLRLMEREAQSLGVRVISFKLHFNSYRLLGRIEYGEMDERQRFLLRGASRLILAMAAQEANAEEREICLVETTEMMIFGFRLDWQDALTGRQLESEGRRKLFEIESWD